jgi:hypothetical protein
MSRPRPPLVLEAPSSSSMQSFSTPSTNSAADKAVEDSLVPRVVAGVSVTEGILLVSTHLSMNKLVGNLAWLASLGLFALLESGVSDIGGVSGVPALVELSSKILRAVEDELELDAEDAVAQFG